MALELKRIDSTDAAFPETLVGSEGRAYSRVWAVGDLSILDQRLVGFFCSVKGTGEAILRTLSVLVPTGHEDVASSMLGSCNSIAYTYAPISTGKEQCND
jgi:hypothetical protein